MLIPTETYLFVFSEIQVAEEKKINRAIGKDFTCGLVAAGGKKAPYSKIIRESELEGMCSQYPDSKIVAKGQLNKMNFSPIIRGALGG